jgi:hypothetical protein
LFKTSSSRFAAVVRRIWRSGHNCPRRHQ